MTVKIVRSDYTEKKYVFIDTDFVLDEVAKIELPRYNEWAEEDGDPHITEADFIINFLNVRTAESDEGLVYVDECGHYIQFTKKFENVIIT